MTTVPTLTTRDLSGDRPEPLKVEGSDVDDTDFDPDKFEEWTELRIIDDGEINGVRFPKDAIITVGPFDAHRLLKTEKAVYVTPPETSEENTATVKDIKNEERLDKELDLLSADDDIDVAANTDPQDTDMIPSPLAADASLSDDDTQDDSTEEGAEEEGIDPFANR